MDTVTSPGLADRAGEGPGEDHGDKEMDYDDLDDIDIEAILSRSRSSRPVRQQPLYEGKQAKKQPSKMATSTP